jgi:hypothetical protein
MVDKVQQDSFLDAIDGIDQSTVEQHVATFPLVQWQNGDQKMKKSREVAAGVPYTGGWFISAENAGGAEELPGWAKSTLDTSSGAEIPGFFKRDIKIAIIHSRKRWMVRQQDAQPIWFPWKNYDKALAAAGTNKPSGNEQLLCWVEGLDVINPVVITLKGMVGMAFSGGQSKQGVVEAFGQRIISTANAALRATGRKEQYPFRAFWLSIGPKRDAKGEPIIEMVGPKGTQSPVTLPVLIGVSQKPDVAEVGKFFVGKELLAKLNDTWTEQLDWLHAWDKIRNNAQTEEEAAATKDTASAGKIVAEDGTSDIDMGSDEPTVF